MAVKAKTVVSPGQNMDAITWAAMVNTDTGEVVDVQGARSLTAMLQAGGVLGIGGNCRWEGSFDNVNWFTMTSEIGIPVAANVVALVTPVMLKERPRWVRPNISAGDGTTSLIPL